MPDIFDQIEAAPQRDIFDQIGEEPKTESIGETMLSPSAWIDSAKNFLPSHIVNRILNWQSPSGVQPRPLDAPIIPESVTKPISEKVGETVGNAVSMIPGYETEKGVQRFAQGAGESAANLAAGMVSPDVVIGGAGIKAGGALAATIQSAFAAQMASQAPDAFKKSVAAVRSGDAKEAGKSFLELAADTGLPFAIVKGSMENPDNHLSPEQLDKIIEQNKFLDKPLPEKGNITPKGKSNETQNEVNEENAVQRPENVDEGQPRRGAAPGEAPPGKPQGRDVQGGVAAPPAPPKEAEFPSTPPVEPKPPVSETIPPKPETISPSIAPVAEGKTYYSSGETGSGRGGVQYVSETPEVASQYQEGGKFGRPGAKMKSFSADLKTFDATKSTPKERAEILGENNVKNGMEPDGHLNFQWYEGDPSINERLKKAGYDSIKVSEGENGVSIAVLDKSKLKPSKPSSPAAESKPLTEKGKVRQDAKEQSTLNKLGVKDYDELDQKATSGALKPAQVRQAKKALDALSKKPAVAPEENPSVTAETPKAAEASGVTPISMGGRNPADPREISPANLALLGDSLKTLADQKGGTSPQRAFSLAEKLAAIKKSVQSATEGLRAVGSYLKQRLEGYPKFDTFQGLLGDRHLALSESALNARRFMKTSMKAIPDKLTREAISNWVDAGGDDAKIKEGMARTKDRYKPGYARALKLTPEEKVIAQNIQNYFEARLNDAIEAGILEEGIENYIHRYFEKSSSWKDGILAELRNGIFTGQPALAKQRTFALDSEAEAAGYKPEKDFAKRVVAYDLALNKAIADRQLVKGLMELKTKGGDPWISVGGVAKKIGGDGTDGALLVKPSIKPKNVAEYKAFDHPALRKWKWVAEDDSGKPILVQGSVLVHPDALPKVRALFEGSRVRANPVGRAMLNLGSTVKQTMLDLSIFHQVQIGIHAAEHQRGQTRIVTMPEIDLTNPDQRGLVRGGMVIGDTTGRQHFDEGLAGSSLSKHLPFGIGEKVQQYKEWLFSDYIPKLKMKTGLMALERNRELFPNLSEDEVYHLTANQMNAAFGELNYAMMGRSTTMQDALRLTLLSPDFTEARARFVGQALTKYGGRPHIEGGKLKIGEQGKALLFGAATLYVTARILNKLVNGEYHFEPKNAFNVLHNGKAYSLRTVQGDVLKAATEPAQFIRNRLNPVYGRTLMEWANGRDYFGRKRGFTQQVKDAAEQVVPISVKGLFSGREQSLSESLMNSMGVTEHRDSPTQRISELAEKWKEKNKVFGEPGEFIYDPDKDPYRDITLAARYNGEAAVRSEILKAVQKGADVNKITKHYDLSVKHPFTGSTKSNEAKFKASLSADDRKQYEDAVKEKKKIAVEVHRAAAAGWRIYP